MAEETIDPVHAFYADGECTRQLPWKKGLSKLIGRCLQTKAVSSVQSPWFVCCI